MKYRAEIDGLRAIAVIPVVLFHAGFSLFGGGFVGVDIFFTISGYLITSIILSELAENRFSIIDFYERRARRILPALFVVMAASSVFAYLWMLPDELENFGQSLVATNLFSNNVLIFLTSGYWALASEFKPLLHTWSLGVEEQYYVIFPLFLIAAWKLFREKILLVLAVIALASLFSAEWLVSRQPIAAFCLLPTRAWELLLGSFAAFYFSTGGDRFIRVEKFSGAFSVVGVILILYAILMFDGSTPNPSLYTLVPTVGALLIILFAGGAGVVNRILSSRPFVGIGLISYSAYLWHFPLFAFARIYSITPLSSSLSALLCVLTLLFAYLSWRFVESPFRNKFVWGRTAIFSSSMAMILSFVAFGLYLHKTHGVPRRIYDENTVSIDDMYISYNQRVYRYKKDSFENEARLNLLVLGNSFARDFVNMTLENFDVRHLEIVYRDDFGGCLSQLQEAEKRRLIHQANIVVLASGEAEERCVRENIDLVESDGGKIFYTGTKHFGFNLNWVARLDTAQRRNLFNPLLQKTKDEDENLSHLIPKENYISLLNEITHDGLVPITDDKGRLLSPDRAHLTRQGAEFIGKRVLVNSAYGVVLKAAAMQP